MAHYLTTWGEGVSVALVRLSSLHRSLRAYSADSSALTSMRLLNVLTSLAVTVSKKALLYGKKVSSLRLSNTQVQSFYSMRLVLLVRSHSQHYTHCANTHHTAASRSLRQASAYLSHHMSFSFALTTATVMVITQVILQVYVSRTLRS